MYCARLRRCVLRRARGKGLLTRLLGKGTASSRLVSRDEAARAGASASAVADKADAHVGREIAPPSKPSVLPILLLAAGGTLHAFAQSAAYLELISGVLQESLLPVSRAVMFAPALYALRHSWGRAVVRRLMVLGVGFELVHQALDIGDDVAYFNWFWLFDEAYAVHVIAQEVTGAAALALLLGSLYYFVVSYQTSDARLARERDNLKEEIRQRLDLEAALEKSEAMFRTLVQGTSDAFLITGRDGRVRYAPRSRRRSRRNHMRRKGPETSAQNPRWSSTANPYNPTG